MTFLEDKNVLGESQGAFRKNRRPEDHLFTLNGTYIYAPKENTSIFI
jgi:hypothetical protein